MAGRDTRRGYTCDSCLLAQHSHCKLFTWFDETQESVPCPCSVCGPERAREAKRLLALDRKQLSNGEAKRPRQPRAKARPRPVADPKAKLCSICHKPGHRRTTCPDRPQWNEPEAKPLDDIRETMDELRGGLARARVEPKPGEILCPNGHGDLQMWSVEPRKYWCHGCRYVYREVQCKPGVPVPPS